jgi:hypothetical protein
MKRARGLAVMVAALVALTCAAGAQAAIYWGNGSKIGAAEIGGGNPNPNYFQFHHPGGPICDVAVSDTHLYWAEWFGIWRVNLEGPATPTQIVGGLNNPCGIAVDGSYVYWVNRAANSIGRVALDGSQRNDTFISSGLNAPCEVAVDGGHVYWVDGWYGIGRATLDGGAVDSDFITTAPGGCGLAVDQGHLYWAAHGVGAGEGRIGRASLDGNQVEPAFLTGIGGVSSIATEIGHLYWVDRPDGMVYSTIGRATLGGPTVRNLISTDNYNVGGVAVDGRPKPPPLPLPSRPFRLGQITYNQSRGTAAVDVWVPERGDLVVSTPVGWWVNKGPEPPPWHGGSFRWRLKVWPGGKGKTGDRIRRQLAEHGRAALTLRVAYNETGQLPVTASKRLVLRKHKQRPSRPR